MHATLTEMVELVSSSHDTMSFKVAIGGIFHETNSYCRESTFAKDFKVVRGQEIIDKFGGTQTYIGGMLDAASKHQASVTTTLHADAQPSGTIDRDTYVAFRDEFVESVRKLLPLDAVAIDLHGAGVADGFDDLEGDVCTEIRSVVGDATKIVVSLDLHGNITQRMADTVELMLGVHTYPHEDMYERGYEAVDSIPRLLSGEMNPVTHIETLPMLLPTVTTRRGPAAEVNELCAEIERREGVIDCTFFHGFPHTDIPQVGCHVVCTTNNDPDSAVAFAREVASFVWSKREDFRSKAHSPKEAIDLAMSTEGGPIVINETSDNPGGGAPGDGTHLLKAMVDSGVVKACFGFIWDPEVAEKAHEAGVGSTIDVELGGKYDDLHGDPIPLTVYVKALTDGKLTLQALARGLEIDLGKMARLVSGGIDILVSSERNQTLDDEVFKLHGIDVGRYKIVALKSSQHFRAGFEPLAKEIITADSPGLTTLSTEVFDRTRAGRPMWPKDQEATYSPGENS